MISPKVMVELHQAKLVPTQFTVTKPGEHAWSAAEQRRFWEAIHRFPQGPWTAIAAYVGSKSTRQAMTHAQKLRQKLNRWKRRVRNDASNSNSCSSGASSPRSDLNEYEEEIEEMDDGALCAVDEEDQHKQSAAAVDMKHETQQQQQFEYNSHQHNEHAEHAPVKSFFEMSSSASSSSHSPDDVACDNDAYLDHLLSDIEPVLEHVAIFTTSPRPEYEATYYSEFADMTMTSSASSSSYESKQPLASDHAGIFALYSSPPHFALGTVGNGASLQQQHQPQYHQHHQSGGEYAASVDFRL